MSKNSQLTPVNQSSSNQLLNNLSSTSPDAMNNFSAQQNHNIGNSPAPKTPEEMAAEIYGNSNNIAYVLGKAARNLVNSFFPSWSSKAPNKPDSKSDDNVNIVKEAAPIDSEQDQIEFQNFINGALRILSEASEKMPTFSLPMADAAEASKPANKNEQRFYSPREPQLYEILLKQYDELIAKVANDTPTEQEITSQELEAIKKIVDYFQENNEENIEKAINEVKNLNSFAQMKAFQSLHPYLENLSARNFFLKFIDDQTIDLDTRVKVAEAMAVADPEQMKLFLKSYSDSIKDVDTHGESKEEYRKQAYKTPSNVVRIGLSKAYVHKANQLLERQKEGEDNGQVIIDYSLKAIILDSVPIPDNFYNMVKRQYQKLGQEYEAQKVINFKFARNSDDSFIKMMIMPIAFAFLIVSLPDILARMVGDDQNDDQNNVERKDHQNNFQNDFATLKQRFPNLSNEEITELFKEEYNKIFPKGVEFVVDLANKDKDPAKEIFNWAKKLGDLFSIEVADMMEIDKVINEKMGLANFQECVIKVLLGEEVEDIAIAGDDLSQDDKEIIKATLNSIKKYSDSRNTDGIRNMLKPPLINGGRDNSIKFETNVSPLDLAIAKLTDSDVTSRVVGQEEYEAKKNENKNPENKDHNQQNVASENVQESKNFHDNKAPENDDNKDNTPNGTLKNSQASKVSITPAIIKT